MHWFMQDGPYPVNIGFTAHHKDLSKLHKRLMGCAAVEPVGGDAYTWFFNEKPDGEYKYVVISMAPGWADLEPWDLAGVIAHEAVHVAQYVWEIIGEQNPGSEAEAYLVQTITRSILKILG